MRRTVAVAHHNKNDTSAMQVRRNSSRRHAIFSVAISVQLILGGFALATTKAVAADVRNENLETRIAFDIPAQSLGAALKQLAAQAGIQILFEERLVAGRQAPAIKATQTAQQALKALLSETGLEYTAKDDTVAVRPATPSESHSTHTSRAKNKKPEIRVAQSGETQANPGSPDQVGSRDDANPGSLEEVVVTGLRDAGLVNAGVIARRENEAIPFIVMDQLEIERSGATDINEVLRSLPQLAGFQADTQSLTAQRGFAPLGAGVTASTVADMRGFGGKGTTFLVNGRRMPIVRESQDGGPDISRIPLSAIERIEILPSSAGGIYGVNTLGGVVNIILKKNYTGRDLSLYFGQATAGGANEVALTYDEGRQLWQGKGNLAWTLDLRKRDPLYYEDRPLYRRFLERNRSPADGGDLSEWITSGGMISFIPRPGIFVGGFAAPFFTAIQPLNIPGGPSGVEFAALPSNQDGTGLTPDSFLSTAGQLPLSEPYGRFALYNPSESASLNMTYNHELREDRLFWYAEVGLGHTQYEFDTPPFPQFAIMDATDPRNPFRAGVIPGYPGQTVTYFYQPVDLPGTTQKSENSTLRLVLGLNGQIDLGRRSWKWAFDTSSDYNRRYAFGKTPLQPIGLIAGSSVFGAPTTQTNIDFYNVVADHDAFPNANAAREIANSSFRENTDYVRLIELTLRASGELFNMPAGPVQTSLLADGQKQNLEIKFINDYDHQLLNALGVPPYFQESTFSRPKISRWTKQLGAEVVLPVLGRNATVLGIHEMDIVAAYSHNWLTDVKSFDSANLGIRFAPVPAIALRASYGGGTYPPQDGYTTGVTSDFIQDDFFTTDPRRGDTPIGNYTLIGGGNPDLRPEETNAVNFGLIVQPRMWAGFTATFDYGRIKKHDGIQDMDIYTLLANERFYPGRIVRTDPTPSDVANGWAGQIQSIDGRRVNVGRIWTRYLDASVRYHLETASVGNFDVILRSTKTSEFRTRVTPEAPIADTLNQINSPLKFRSSGSIAWQKGSWTVTPSAFYINSYRDILDVPVDSSLTVNMQLSYEDLSSVSQGTGLFGLMQGMQWTIGCNNLFNSRPPYVQNPGGPIVSYYSTYDDPRGRFIYLRMKKSL